MVRMKLKELTALDTHWGSINDSSQKCAENTHFSYLSKVEILFNFSCLLHFKMETITKNVDKLLGKQHNHMRIIWDRWAQFRVSISSFLPTDCFHLKTWWPHLIPHHYFWCFAKKRRCHISYPLSKWNC
jgi:hypothetical protein